MKRVIDRIKRAARAGRRDAYDKKEQLFVAGLSHLLLLLGVWGIMAMTFNGAATRPLPTGFWTIELGIVGLCVVALVDWNDIVGGAFERYIPRDAVITVLGRFRAEGVGDAIRGVLLLVVSLAQFVALGWLLRSTGGAIDSPFAQLALAIAIFTPFIANNWGTMLLVVVVTMGFYVALVVSDGFEAASDVRPSTGAYIAVNLLILAAATLLTLGELVRGERMAGEKPRLGDVLGGQSADAPPEANGPSAPGDPDASFGVS